MLLEAPQREYRLWILDSRRWRRYTPRSDDIVISTYPKCGIAHLPNQTRQRITTLTSHQSTADFFNIG